MSAPTIGFVGQTHLGIVSAVACAAKGFDTVCVDPDPGTIAKLSAGEPSISEPGLPELIAVHRERLTYSSDGAALADCDVIYVSPDVPTDDRGQSDPSRVISLLDIARAEARDDAVIVVLSQVPPGFTRQNAGNRRKVFYQVETLIFGNAVARAMTPERFIVGAPSADTTLPDPYRQFLDSFGCPTMVMRYESAELAKISINCFLAASISTTNTLAELCEAVGADWSEIAPALRLDKRIGPHAYLSPGLGIAGGNLERDLASVCRMAEAAGSDAGVVEAWQANSVHRKGWAAQILEAQLLSAKPDAKIALLGLAYKENTHSMKNAPSLALLQALTDAAVVAYDPVVKTCDAEGVVIAESAMAAVRDAEAVAVMTPWDEFRDLNVSTLAEAMTGRLLLDPYGALERQAAADAGLLYFTLGAPGP